MSHHSRPDSWVQPRPYSDPDLRRLKHGPILPMEEVRSVRWRLCVAAAQGFAIMAGFFALLLGLALVTP